MIEAGQDPGELLDLVRQSPAAVAAKDRAGWVALFAHYSIVEDPVGSRPHLSGVYDRGTGKRGSGPLERFYDTFIAPNTIVFHVHNDVVCGDTVVRDLDIEISMGSRVRVVVPMHLLYETVLQEGEPRIFRLAAHWEFLPMVKQAAAFGWDSVGTLSALGWRMLRLQGLGGTLGFCQALGSVGAWGKAMVEEFVHAYNIGNGVSLQALFAAPEIDVAWPVPGRLRSVDDLLARYQGQRLQVDKLLAAGHAVTASCTLGEGEGALRGVLVFEFTARKRLQRVRAFWPEDAQAASSSPRSG